MQSVQLPPRGQKRKVRSTDTEDREIERISFDPPSQHGRYKRRSTHSPKRAYSLPTNDPGCTPPPIPVLQPPAELDGNSSRGSNLEKYFWMLDAMDFSESVESQNRALKAMRDVYNPIIFSDDMPYNITPLAPILFRPRLPPTLPQSILDLPFTKVIRRYHNLTLIVDNYLRWHGLCCFGWWTTQDLALAASGRNLSFAVALAERPPIPPHILQAPFSTVLVGAPVLSHLIERYHRDVGYDYFGFYFDDPRVRLIESEPGSDIDSDCSSDGYWDSE
ncbi:hypothetical protein F5Y08DRAFT_344173 [Xylaria arbuscula]|nr:hypothetical protein F5Y08DRAFT_344173 [Xylaria arbuscula]